MNVSDDSKFTLVLTTVPAAADYQGTTQVATITKVAQLDSLGLTPDQMYQAQRAVERATDRPVRMVLIEGKAHYQIGRYESFMDMVVVLDSNEYLNPTPAPMFEVVASGYVDIND